MKVATLKSLVFLFFCAFLTSCSDDDQPKQFALDQPSAIDAEDYAVYTAVISSFNSSNVVITQKTAFGMSFMMADDNYVYALSEGNPGFEPEMATTLIDNNVNPLFLDYAFPISSTHVILVPEAELNYIFNDGHSNKDWKQFYNTFPNTYGYTQFSVVAYNTDKTKALLETANSACSICGQGALYYLEKEDGLWIIKKIVETWIT